MNTENSTIETFALSLPKAPEMIELNPADATAHGGVSIEDAIATEGFLVVTLAYLQQSANDLIRLYLNDEKVADATVAIGKEADDIPLRIPAERFQKGENRVKFSVERISGNGEEFSKDLILLHRTSPPGDKPAVLNLSVSHASIGPGEADKVSVTVSYKNMHWYDRIVVDCNGVQVRHQLLPDSTSPLPALPKSIVIPIPRAVLEQGGDDSDFEFKFRITDYLTNASGWSDTVIVDVHLDRLELPMPTLLAPAVNPIDVLAYPNGVTLRIKFPEAQSGDRARLVEVNAPAGSPQFPLSAFDKQGQVDIVLTPAFLVARLDTKLTFRWNLNRGGGQAGKSAALDLKVLKIADGIGLPKPMIVEGTGPEEARILDLNLFNTDAAVVVAAWPLITAGQKVWLDCIGSDQDGNEVSLSVLAGVAVTESNIIKGLRETIDRDFLRPLKNHTGLRLKLLVTFNGSSEKELAILFPTTTYIILSPEPKTIDSFGDHGEMGNNQTIDFNLFSLSRKIISGAPYTVLAGNLGILSGHQENIRRVGEQTLEIKFKNTPVHTIELHIGISNQYDGSWAPNRRPIGRIEYFNQGQLLESEEVLFTESQQLKKISMKNNRTFDKLTITVYPHEAHGAIGIGNIKFSEGIF